MGQTREGRRKRLAKEFANSLEIAAYHLLFLEDRKWFEAMNLDSSGIQPLSKEELRRVFNGEN